MTAGRGGRPHMRTLGPVVAGGLVAGAIAFSAVAGDIWSLLLVVPYGATGALLAIRRPANPIGWILIATAWSLAWATVRSGPAGSLIDASLLHVMLVAGGNWSWAIAIVLITVLTLIFPSGRLPERHRWAALAIILVGVAAIAGTVAASTIALPTADGDIIEIANPIGLPAGSPVAELLDVDGSWFAVALGLFAIGVAWLLARARASVGVERLQYRWLVATLAVAAVCSVAAFTAVSIMGSMNSDPRVSDPAVLLAWAPSSASLAAIPVSIAVAVLRYRLFEIDRIISRTIAWAIVTGVLVAVFVGAVLGLQALLENVTQGQTLAVAAATLVAYALFQPVRRSVQRVVDRRFDRSRYDAERTAAAFAERVRHDIGLESLVAELGTTIDAAVRPSAVAVWLPAKEITVTTSAGVRTTATVNVAGLAGRIVLILLLLAAVPLVASDVTAFAQYAPYAAVGGFLAIRRPRNAIGWLLIGIGFAFIGTSTPTDLDVTALQDGTASPRDVGLVWFGMWAGGASFLLYAALAMTFPSGELPGGRWRRPTIVALTVAAAIVAIPAFVPVLEYSVDGPAPVLVPNPVGWLPQPSPEVRVIVELAVTLLPISIFAASVVGLLIRYRRSAGIVRLQIRWLLATIAFVVVGVVVGLFGWVLSNETAGFVWIPVLIGYPLVPIAVGVAVTRYRLFEIDRIISRTIGWAVVTGLLVAVFAGGVLALQAVLADVTQGQTLAVAASTLLAFALFQPVRRPRPARRRPALRPQPLRRRTGGRRLRRAGPR